MDINHLAEQQPDVAEQVLERVIDTQSDDIFGLQVLGSVKVALGKPEEAILYFLRAIQLNPRSEDLNLRIALAYRDLHNYHCATMYMFRVIEQSQSAQNWTWLGKLFSEIENFVAAKYYFQKAISTDPDHVPAYYGLLSVSAMEKDWERFIEIYEWIVEHTPTWRIGAQIIRYCPKPLMGLFSYLVQSPLKNGDSPMIGVTDESPPAGVTVT